MPTSPGPKFKIRCSSVSAWTRAGTNVWKKVTSLKPTDSIPLCNTPESVTYGSLVNIVSLKKVVFWCSINLTFPPENVLIVAR